MGPLIMSRIRRNKLMNSHHYFKDKKGQVVSVSLSEKGYLYNLMIIHKNSSNPPPHSSLITQTLAHTLKFFIFPLRSVSSSVINLRSESLLLLCLYSVSFNIHNQIKKLSTFRFLQNHIFYSLLDARSYYLMMIGCCCRSSLLLLMICYKNLLI